MRRLDYVSSLFLFFLSIALLLYSIELPIWGELGPVSGFFPLILSILLGFFSLIIFIRALLQTKKTQEIIKILGPKKGKFLLYIASFFVFSFFFPKLGYSLTLAVFLIFILKFVEKQSWKITWGIIVISIIVSNILFVNFLSVPLPEGILSSVIKKFY